MNQGDVKKKKDMDLTFDRKLFMGTHVQNIVVAKHHGHTTDGICSPISKALRKYVLFEMMEASHALQDTITTSTFRKKNIYVLTKKLTKEKDDEDAKEVDNEYEKKSN